MSADQPSEAIESSPGPSTELATARVGGPSARRSPEPSTGPTRGPTRESVPFPTRAPAGTTAKRVPARTVTAQALTPPRVTPLPGPVGVAGTRIPGAARTATSAAAGTAGTANEESEVLRLTNLERAKAGCPALTRNAILARVARAHSKDMAQRRYFTHNSPDGRTPFDRMTAAGYRYSDAAENIAAGQPTSAVVLRDWMASAGHRANIVDCGLRELGVGLHISGSSTYTYYWTQDFGTPR